MFTDRARFDKSEARYGKYLFSSGIKKNKIDVKGSILRVRDFIYIDDVVEVCFNL